MPGWRKSFTSCLQKLHDEGKQVFCFNVRDNLYTYVGIAMGWIGLQELCFVRAFSQRLDLHLATILAV